MKTAAPGICVPICVRRAAEIPAAMERARRAADLIELRLDCLDADELNIARDRLPEWLNQFGAPVVLTLRASEQGGRSELDDEARARFWMSLHKTPNDSFMDLELNLAERFAQERHGELPFDWHRVICSHHDFTGVPADLEQIYQRMAATPAGILKIAVQANDATDCVTVFRLLERAQRDGRQMIAIAMGQAGMATRILGPSRGSFLTYASLDESSTTAPGQLDASDLRALYRVDQINRETQIFGLIGRPVSHSLSPHIHNRAFAAVGLDAVYLTFEVLDAGQFFSRMVRVETRELDWNLRGLSVTSPHKSAVIERLDWIEPAAKEIGAVNTIVVKQNELHGYNTDAPGFISPLREKFGSLRDARCAIIGAGGGARAVLWALRKAGARSQLFVRNVGAGESVATEFGAGCSQLARADFAGFDIVINATPLGTKGAQVDETPAVAAQLRNVRLAYDLVYNPLETRFLREARAAGCETVGGLKMLVAQAIEQFKLWTGQSPPVETMRAGAMKALENNPST
ncbi:MAG: shikimate dehydrogenase [Acidobacteriota bacterium]